MKSFTDLEQSNVLSKILPLESADISWVSCDDGNQKYYRAENRKIVLNYEKKHWIPCWSFAALLSVLPSGYVIVKNYHSLYFVESRDHRKSTNIFNNPVDACYEMILKLHELNLL